MAESHPSLDRSTLVGSDQLSDHFCEPCYAASNKVKPVAGYGQNCVENLCIDCFTSHCGLKLFRSHRLVDKSTRPKTGSTPRIKPKKLAKECHLHKGERIHAYCCSHSTFICKVCLTIDHETCHTDKISKLARNIANSQYLTNLNERLSTLKKGFNDNQSKKVANNAIIQRNHRDALYEMKKLQAEFDKLMKETVKKADNIRTEDLNKIEKVSATCGIVVEQIDKMTAHLETLTKNQANESLFISTKRAENSLKSLEDKLDKLDKDNTVRVYKFVPDVKLNAMLNDLKVLGKPSGLRYQNVSTKADQKAKKLAHVKDLNVISSYDKFNIFEMYGSLVLPNNQILISDSWNNKLKLIDINQNKIISEKQLSGSPYDITKVRGSEVAVCVYKPNTIQFISVSKNSMSKVREVTVDGDCEGIAYNDRDQTLIVTFCESHKVKILDMAGTELKCIEHDSMGGKLFTEPWCVSLTPDMTSIYVTDATEGNNSVTLMSLNGDVKAVYKDKTDRLSKPYGVYVHTSGLVYVVGCMYNTVHELDPESGEFKVLLEEKDGLAAPVSISYCEIEDKMYIGMMVSSVMKVFQMK